jgi:hypothetical protein
MAKAIPPHFRYTEEEGESIAVADTLCALFRL